MTLPPLHLRCLSQPNNLTRLSTRHTTILNQTRHFHPSRRKLQSETFPDHYATLELPSSATAPEIKKQFYALSKKYHPDVNHTPSASERFVKISEAYHILGSAEKKGKYDRDLSRAQGSTSGYAGNASGGSYSSRGSGGPAGGRPASGLSKRRSQFRGPPPSFYAQGGYGTQGAKRQRASEEQQARAQQSGPYDPNHPSGLGSQPGYTGSGGFSPGSGDAEFDPDPSMPYFDKAGHRRTHEGLGARRGEYADGRKPRGGDTFAAAQGSGGGGLVANFLIVSAVVATATVAASLILEFVRQGPGAHSGAGTGRRREARPDG